MMWAGILEFLWGLGLFLFGANYLESAVGVFSKGGFKQILKKFTTKKIPAFFTGLVSTLILQSSNLVSVLVLAFVGTGIVSLTGGITVMLGSSIGTTIPDALLGSIGLNYDIKMLTLPLLFLGAVGLTFFSSHEKIIGVSKACVALGLTFLSFSFMKNGLVFVTDMVDLSSFMSMNLWIFFLIGLALTLLVQAWGAVFIVALTSASSGLITPEVAFPIILWSYIGATITIVMASLGHQPTIKKQVAAGHVGFNTLAALIGMFGMPFILWLFTTSIFPKVGVVMGLSIFYIAMRLFTAILVFPFIDFFTRLIQKLIKEDEAELTLAIQKIPTESVDPELVLLAIKQDLLVYFKKIISYNLNIWDFYLTDISQGQADMEKLFKREVNLGKNYLKKEYQETKGIQEQLLNFLVKMNQVEVTKAEDADQLTSLYQVVIDIGDSSKYLKDVWDRVEDRQRSTSEDLQKDYNTLRKMVLEFYTSVLHLLAHIDDKQAFALLHGLLDKIKKNDKKYLMMFKHKEGDDVDLANLIQVSRYFSMSCFSLVRALENVSLSEEDKKYLKEHINALF